MFSTRRSTSCFFLNVLLKFIVKHEAQWNYGKHLPIEQSILE
jgi:hypothetical protein